MRSSKRVTPSVPVRKRREWREGTGRGMRIRSIGASKNPAVSLRFRPFRGPLFHPSQYRPDGRRFYNGQAGLARQAAGLRLPVLRDLRRPRFGLGLRPARGGAQAEHQGPLVAIAGPCPGRHRGPRRRRSSCTRKVWEASGHVAGFTDPLVDCRTCKARFRADKLADARCPQKPSKPRASTRPAT